MIDGDFSEEVLEKSMKKPLQVFLKELLEDFSEKPSNEFQIFGGIPKGILRKTLGVNSEGIFGRIHAATFHGILAGVSVEVH